MDALLPDAASHRRRVYGAVARTCAGHFGLLLGGKAGLEDPDIQAAELDSSLERGNECGMCFRVKEGYLSILQYSFKRVIYIHLSDL